MRTRGPRVPSLIELILAVAILVVVGTFVVATIMNLAS